MPKIDLLFSFEKKKRNLAIFDILILGSKLCYEISQSQGAKCCMISFI